MEFLEKKLNRIAEKNKIELKYLAVIEYQKRGAIHYHMLCNLNKDMFPGNDEPSARLKDYTNKEILFSDNVWCNGLCNIKNITKVDNLGAYIIKYITKEMTTQKNKKKYLKSNNLLKGEVIGNKVLTQEELENKDRVDIGGIVESYRDRLPVYTSSYHNDFWGKITYREYNLDRED